MDIQMLTNKNGDMFYPNTEVDAIADFSDKLNTVLSSYNLQNRGKQVWAGAAYLSDTQIITPSITLDKCPIGWLVLYQPYDSIAGKTQSYDFNYGLIPKTHARDFNGITLVHHLEVLDGTGYNKCLYVTNTTITGHRTNMIKYGHYVTTRVYAV
ncbi:hypothetical protein MEPL4_4c00210 [Melissococcus plutonius]|uniref:hypothetical protein n=1 Tax=Melissococcus plutonius TaxID=33970 RepID=UPI00065DF7AB|nr:hypothetical protein [Melissococcus plutonius]AIM25748.1 hypothetical protein MEPL_c010010 [Melissococcus plutonius S1]KMT23432.1 hypothetical protein MEPL2_43p00140 [Melissococcus plutonius]KMT25190.1 hypothetical protein MEPL2_2c07480 [Melissococcus plutonius]KMT26096.1 hypothetical protein MEPL3_3c00210 [Melissococcus plutonius]KMT26826.1 hypothetical protein MEPL1_4c00210 [Melissococcus plutonius]